MAAAREGYDIFLSHCFKDKDLADGLTEQFESLGYTVYIDWREDPQLDRSHVNRETAQVLRQRLATSKALFYVTSENAGGSKWMPWELGYMDGVKRTAAILPVTEKAERGDDFDGQEYLGLYPYVTVSNDTASKERIWVRDDAKTYIWFDRWIEGKVPQVHHSKLLEKRIR
jgi:TIR domain